MVAVAQYIPTDPEEKASVLAVLSEHPELQDFIQRASEKAGELFPNVRIALDTVQYDEWDLPVRMLVYASDRDVDGFMNHYHRYSYWLAYESGYPDAIIQVLPLWAGPAGSGE